MSAHFLIYVDTVVLSCSEKVGFGLSPTGLFFGVQGCHRYVEHLLETPMTHPGRNRRGHTAPRRSTLRRLSGPSRQGLEQDLNAATSLDHADADSGEFAGHALSRRSHHGIVRPPRSGLSGEVAAPATNRSSTTSEDMPAQPLLYTAEQAAVLLQVRPSWLRRKAAARAVPCRFVGKHLRFSRSDIETIAEG
jgi:helix-turn-helix protein